LNTKKIYIKRISVFSIVLVNIILWVFPSDLAYNVAQQRDILLGRYTVEHFTVLLILIPISLLVINAILSKKRDKIQKQKREDLFKTIVLITSIVLGVVTADILLRVLRQKNYAGNRTSYHRTPNKIKKGVNKDVPYPVFTYPLAQAGYPDVPFTMTIDKRGFRNTTDLEQYDIVTLGDSFTEGSHVSDEQAWLVQFAQNSGMTVYNLGMSDGNPLTYLDTLKRYGLALSPKIVICTICEGNDFRSSNFQASKVERRERRSLEYLIDSSPLRHALKKVLINLFGRVNSKRFSKDADNLNSPSHPMYAVSWLPIRIPQDSDCKYYTFKIKRLLAHFDTKENIRKSTGCQGLIQYLREINRTCKENDIRLIIMYIPDKPHVILPLVSDNLSAQQIRAFMSLKEKELPPPDKLIDTLISRLDNHEFIIQDFCSRESVELISLTESLQHEILKGNQAYYTYYQHWTPIGQTTAARAVYTYLKEHPH
jgi:hypothetical protein